MYLHSSSHHVHTGLQALHSVSCHHVCITTYVMSSSAGTTPQTSAPQHLQACIALTYPDRIHSFHLKHLQQPGASLASAEAAADSAPWLALLQAVNLTPNQRRVLICLRRMCAAIVPPRSGFLLCSASRRIAPLTTAIIQQQHAAGCPCRDVCPSALCPLHSPLMCRRFDQA